MMQSRMKPLAITGKIKRTGTGKPIRHQENASKFRKAIHLSSCLSYTDQICFLLTLPQVPKGRQPGGAGEDL